MRKLSAMIIGCGLLLPLTLQAIAQDETATGGALEAVKYLEDFESYQTSDDPIFDRFQVQFDGAPSEAGWSVIVQEACPWIIPSLFVERQTLSGDPPIPDPLPRWHGIRICEIDRPTLAADVMPDGVIDLIDLSLLLEAFGDSGGSTPAADLNTDGVVDSADLGILIGHFGESVGSFCVFEVTRSFVRNELGEPQPPGAMRDGPLPGERVALRAGSIACDAGPDYGFEPQSLGLMLFGEWRLVMADQQGLLNIDFVAEPIELVDATPENGTVLALADRLEDGCGSIRARIVPEALVDTDNPVVASSEFGIPAVVEFDIFLASLESKCVIEPYSLATTDAGAVTRLQIGGMGYPDIQEWGTFVNADGFFDRFMFTLNREHNMFDLPSGTRPDFYYFDPDADVHRRLPGKRPLIGEWMTLRFVITPDNLLEVWLRDSETRALDDLLPGDNGATTATIVDDLEDGFARIFPGGPFGRIVYFNHLAPVLDQPPLDASALTEIRIRFDDYFDNGFISDSLHKRRICFDNFRISGARSTETP